MKKRLLMLMLSLVFLLGNVIAQQKIVTGKVTGAEDGLPLPGVSVKVKGTNQGVITDVNGSFGIRVEKGQTLVFSFIGSVTQEKTVVDQNTINVKLRSDAKSLDEVVVVGYGTQKKANLTGAVSTVDVAKTFENKPINDPAKALQGTVPGLTITYGNGGLTSAPSIRIRGVGSINGTSSPLILVDNVETSDLSVINPNDIESISVLKDAASTSIYGARAAFGVVLVKTKSGKRNQPTKVTYSNNFSWNKPTVLPDFADPVKEIDGIYEGAVRAGTTNPEVFGMDLLKLKEGIINWKEKYSAKNTGKEMIEGEDFELRDNRLYFYKVWDPKKEMLNDFTTQQNHNINIRGGSEKVGYYMSAGFSKDGGVLKLNPDEVKKYNITTSVNATVTKWMDVDAKFMYRNFKYDYPYPYQSYWYYFWRWGSYFPYGTWKGNYFRHTPAYLANAQKNDLTDNFTRIDLGTTFKINKNLSARADYTIGRDNNLRHEVGGPIMAWDFWSPGIPKLANIASTSQDEVEYSTGRFMVNTLNAYFTYQDTIATSHNVKLTGGVNYENYEYYDVSATRRQLLDPNKGELVLATGDQLATGGHGVSAYAGYFGRLNYDYKGKYILELNGRYDGSSSFSKDNRWAFFPSASLGYRLTEEDFMEFIKPSVNDIKIRASYGSIGNQQVGGQYYLPSMSSSKVNWITPSGSTLVQAIAAPRAVASSLTWETVRTLNIGTDIRFFKDIFGLTFDWYQRDTRGMLANTSVAATFGTTGPKINAGNFRNRGWEVSLDANYPVNDELRFYSTLTLADNKTVFTKWDNPAMLISQINNGIYYEGQAYGEIWGFETDGFFKSEEDVKSSASQTALQNGNFVFGPGDVKYRDLNNDGVINAGKTTLADHGDLKVIGNTQPRYQYGARLGGVWKSLDFDVFIQGVGKRDYWGIGDIAIPLYRGSDIMYDHQLDYWTKDNPNARYPRPYVGNATTKISNFPTAGNNFYPQSKYLLNLAYCRLRNVTVGYNLPKATLQRYKVDRVRLYVSGQNLAEISNVGVKLDPEITDGESNFLGRTFPFQRMFSFGLDLTF